MAFVRYNPTTSPNVQKICAPWLAFKIEIHWEWFWNWIETWIARGLKIPTSNQNMFLTQKVNNTKRCLWFNETQNAFTNSYPCNQASDYCYLKLKWASPQHLHIIANICKLWALSKALNLVANCTYAKYWNVREKVIDENECTARKSSSQSQIFVYQNNIISIKCSKKRFNL